jgi:hypothetical protein
MWRVPASHRVGGSVWCACTVLLMVAGFFDNAAAQIAAATISGIVVDQAGAPVPGASVTVTATDTGRPRTAFTDRNGRYLAPALPPGRYEVRVELSGFRTADSFNRRLERDYSTGDIPHVFVASAVWEMPFGAGRAHHPGGVIGAFANGWTLSGVLTLQSGTPVAVTQATNNNAFGGFGTQRPNLSGDPTLPSDERSPARWFNTAAFSTAPQFTLGNASRNPVRGPGYRNLDLAVFRRLALPAGNALELRVEAFNLTNTTPLGAPNGSFGSAAFGTITTAGDPRVLQLAVKFVF